jgi:signal transduction histidine kinase/ligand-binding sensor domain-containing protein
MRTGVSKCIAGFAMVMATAASAWAISPALPLAQAAQSHWDGAHGLPEETFANLHSTEDGYLWLASNFGLVRFDSERARVFYPGSAYRSLVSHPCSSNSLTNLITTPNGELWVTSSTGCLFRVLKDALGTFANPSFVAYEPGSLTATPWNVILRLSLSPDREYLELIRANGIHRFRWDSLPPVKDNSAPIELKPEHLPGWNLDPGTERQTNSQDVRGNFFTLLKGNQPYRGIRQEIGIQWQTLPPLPIPLDATLTRLYAGSKSRLYVATYRHGLFVRQTGQWVSYSKTNGLPANHISGMTEDMHGCLWFGMPQAVGRLCPQEQGPDKLEWIPLGVAEEEILSTLTEDAAGNIWVGGRWGNLYRLSDRLFHTYTKRDGLPESHLTGVVVTQDGSLWGSLRTEGAVVIAPGHSPRPVPCPAAREMQALVADQSDVIAAGLGGLFLLNTQGCRPLQLNGELRVDIAGALTWESPGTLLYSNNSGNYRLRRSPANVWNVEPLGGPQRIRQWATGPQGGIWAVSLTEGLLRLRGDKYEAAPAAQPARARSWFSISRDAEGRLWLGTGNGIAIYSPEREEFLHPETLLPADQFFHIAHDQYGMTWCATRNGILRFNTQSTLDRLPSVSPFRALRFSALHSLPTTNFGLVTSSTGVAGRDNRIWFPGLQGLVGVQPSDFERPYRQPKPLLLEALADDEPLNLNAAAGLPLRIPQGTARLSLRYQALRRDLLGGAFCRYRLEGLETHWTPCETQGAVQYTNLRPGNYTFVLEASSDGEDWSSAPNLHVPINIPAAVWQQPLVQSAALVLLGGLIFGWFQLRQRALLARNRLLEEKVEERTAKLSSAMQAAEAASRAKSEFLATMSHEIRTPLNGVLGAADLLNSSALDPERQKLVEVIRSSCEHLLGIVDDVLDLARLEAGKLQLESTGVNILEICRQVVDLFSARAEAKNLELRFLPSSGLPGSVLTDPKRLRQILLNLVGNAVKFTDTGHVLLEVSTEASDLVFRVSDTGPGIPDDKLSTLFDAFMQADSSTTRRFGGSGLGLAIVQRLVLAMQGSVSVESRLGEGSRFTVRLPWAPALSAELSKDNETPENYRPLGLRVLVAEDNLVNQLIIEKMLSRLGCESILARNGSEALNILYRDTRLDVVLMDCQMPVLDGFAATQELRRGGGANARLPVIALTASALAEDRERCLQAGMSGFLAKPLLLETLAESLKPYSKNNI